MPSNDKKLTLALKALLGINGTDPIIRDEKAELEDLTDDDGNILEVPELTKAQMKRLKRLKNAKRKARTGYNGKTDNQSSTNRRATKLSLNLNKSTTRSTRPIPSVRQPTSRRKATVLP